METFWAVVRQCLVIYRVKHVSVSGRWKLSFMQLRETLCDWKHQPHFIDENVSMWTELLATLAFLTCAYELLNVYHASHALQGPTQTMKEASTILLSYGIGRYTLWTTQKQMELQLNGKMHLTHLVLSLSSQSISLFFRIFLKFTFYVLVFKDFQHHILILMY